MDMVRISTKKILYQGRSRLFAISSIDRKANESSDQENKRDVYTSVKAEKSEETTALQGRMKISEEKRW